MTVSPTARLVAKAAAALGRDIDILVCACPLLHYVALRQQAMPWPLALESHMNYVACAVVRIACVCLCVCVPVVCAGLPVGVCASGRNNAGIGSSGKPAPVVDFDDDFWDLMMEVSRH